MTEGESTKSLRGHGYSAEIEESRLKRKYVNLGPWYDVDAY